MKITAYSTYNLHQLRYNLLQPLQPITAGNTNTHHAPHPNPRTNKLISPSHVFFLPWCNNIFRNSGKKWLLVYNTKTIVCIVSYLGNSLPVFISSYCGTSWTYISCQDFLEREIKLYLISHPEHIITHRDTSIRLRGRDIATHHLQINQLKKKDRPRFPVTFFSLL